MEPADQPVEDDDTIMEKAVAPKGEGALTVVEGAAMATPVEPPPDSDAERNPIFASLVKEDGDIVGLVAYSIYKQNKLDWLLAFKKARSRPPNEAEQAAYIIGENTPRRVAIYRHLADATLSGRGPENMLDPAQRKDYSSFAQTRRPAARTPNWIMTSIISCVVVVIAILFGVWLAAHYGVTAPRS